MGLASFWANITGPRVKEIAPQSEDFWPERGRPTTSRGSKTDIRDGGHSPTTAASGEKKRSRFARSLSRAARMHRSESKGARRPSDHEREPEKELPSVPSLPLSLLAGIRSSEDATPEDIGRPGTAIVSTEGLQALHIFELAAETTLPAEPTTAQENPVIRGRSKSCGPERTTRSSSKKGAWYRVGSSKDKALPPPPPPTAPLPPVPSRPLLKQHSSCAQLRSQSVDASFEPSARSVPPALPRVQSLGGPLDMAPLREPTHLQPPAELPTARSSSDANMDEDDGSSILDSFTSTPGLTHDGDDTPEPSVTSSEVNSLHQPTSPPRERAGWAVGNRKAPSPIRVSAAYGHKHKDSAIGTPKSPYTPTGIKRWTRQGYSIDLGSNAGGSDDIAEAEAEHWNQRPESAIIPPYDLGSAPASNERALAALEFGVLK